MEWFFKIIIYGDEWVIYLVDDDDEVIANKDSGAETDIETKEIHFRRGELTIHTVLHELWHAYFSYTHTGTADLDYEQMEEVSAEMFAYRSIKMQEQAQAILLKLKELRDTAENT